MHFRNYVRMLIAGAMTLAVSAWAPDAALAQEHDLTVLITGAGTVGRVPDLAAYPHDTAVELTAVADNGYTFAGWSGDASGSDNPLIVVMDTIKTITATFTVSTYALTIEIIGQGTVEKVPDLALYPQGTIVDLTATPASGFEFQGFSGAVNSPFNPASLPMSGPKTVTVYFSQNPIPVQVPTAFRAEAMMTGLDYPTGMAFLPDGRLLVVERHGPVRLVVHRHLGAVDPMMVVDSVDANGDRGLSGIAIDPRWPGHPYVYVYYDHLDGHCRISRYTAGGDVANSASGSLTLDPASRFDVLADIPDLIDLHNGGTIRFGPDSMLYAALGDDGYMCAAQDTVSLRGVLVRMEVRGLPEGPGGPADKSDITPPDNPLIAHSSPNARLVWATGLRNPFRFAFDRTSAHIYFGDVGFDFYEEVDVMKWPLPNFGWPFYEGPAVVLPECPGLIPDGPLTPPIYAYDRSGFATSASIIAGEVYRAPPSASVGFPSRYEGDFFFGDYYAGFLRRIKRVEGTWGLADAQGQPTLEDWGTGFEQVSEYAVGPDGALWYCRMSVQYAPGTGEIARIVFVPPALDVQASKVTAVMLAPPAPSPSSGATRLGFALPRAASVRLTLFDAQGRVTRRLVPRSEWQAGSHAVPWDGRTDGGVAAAPGVYLALLEVDGERRTQRVAVVR